MPDYPLRPELFLVAARGGPARQVSAFEGRDGAFAPGGDRIVYVRGPGSWYRQGYRGSANDDIWVMNADGSNNQQLTSHLGQDNYPQWSPDGKYIYYVSDCLGGVANVVRQEVDPKRGKPVPGKGAERVTDQKNERVRRVRLSAGGEWLVYESGADIWVHSLKDRTSRKLQIEINADDKQNSDKITTFNSGATEFAVSHDERHIAFVVHGEIFLMPRTGGKARRLTDSPAADHGIAWSPDNKRILFLSDRSGFEDVYALEADDPDHPELTSAHRFKVKQLTNTPAAEVGLTFSPDGTRVGFLRGGTLVTMNPDGTGEKVIVSQGRVFDFEWSPDSRWICYVRMDGSFASELYIVPAGGATEQDPPRNITRFATYNGGVTWSRAGNKLAFISQRVQNTSSAYVLSLQKPAAAGVSSGKEIDWEGIHLRVKQPTPMTVSECAISGDGLRIAFRATQDGQSDLWIASTDGGQVTRVTTGDTRPAQIQWSRVFPSQLFFKDGTGHIRSLFLTGSSPTATEIAFQAKMVIRQDELFTEIFDQSWRALNDHFYDAQFHGVNWAAVREKYRGLVKHCALKEDLYTLIALMLGELNASHLGITSNFGTADQETADLGLIFDRTFAGPGLKIVEIVHGGPADRRGLNLHSGDVVLAMDGEPIDGKTDTAKLLNDKVGEAIELTVASESADAKAKRRVEVMGVKRTATAMLLYERWIAKNAERVTQLSKGKLGYIHIAAMDEVGLARFVRSLYSDNFDKEGIVLDVRYNGGGFTHDQILNYLVGKEHTIFMQRDGLQGLVLRSFDRKWTRPLVLLINNRSYSDAEIFPHAFRTWGLGKLVGQPTGGHVIGTYTVELIDGSTFRVPRTGIHTIKGVNMEKEGVAPDIEVLGASRPTRARRGPAARPRCCRADGGCRRLEEDAPARRRAVDRLGRAPPVVAPGPPAPTPAVPPKE